MEISRRLYRSLFWSYVRNSVTSEQELQMEDLELPYVVGLGSRYAAVLPQLAWHPSIWQHFCFFYKISWSLHSLHDLGRDFAAEITYRILTKTVCCWNASKLPAWARSESASLHLLPGQPCLPIVSQSVLGRSVIFPPKVKMLLEFPELFLEYFLTFYLWAMSFKNGLVSEKFL